MPTTQSARHKMPFLAISQAQKEVTHNEALVLIDALLHPAVQSQLSAPPTATDADIGKCWLVGSSPTAEWTGKAGQIACWIGGGWRYLMPVEAMRIRLLDAGVDLVRSNSLWIAPLVIPDPANGAIIDAEARAAIVTLLSYFRMIGQVAP